MQHKKRVSHRKPRVKKVWKGAPSKVLVLKVFGKTYKVVHIPYYAAVALEGHGFYSYAGMVLLGFSIVAIFMGVEDAE